MRRLSASTGARSWCMTPRPSAKSSAYAPYNPRFIAGYAGYYHTGQDDKTYSKKWISDYEISHVN